MEVITHSTELFKNIFPSYEKFKEWYLSLPLSDNSADVPSEKTFSLIAFEYNDAHSAYSIDGFKEHFAIDLYTFYKEFEATSKMIDELMRLTDEEIAISDVMTVNVSDTPETADNSNKEDLGVNFISNQQKTFSRKGKLQIKNEQLRNKRYYSVRTFLNKFKHLFIRIISPAYTYVVAEDEHEV